MKTNYWRGNQYVGRVKMWFIKKWQWSVKCFVFNIRQYTMMASMLTLVYVVALLGAKYLHVPVYAEIQTIKEVKIQPEFPPFLKRICDAESGGRQFNKNGSVIRGSVTPSDIGICQINEPINNDLARKLGYDIYTEEGNKAFALYLFNTRGTQPWNASKCTVNGWGTKSECNK